MNNDENKKVDLMAWPDGSAPTENNTPDNIPTNNNMDNTPKTGGTKTTIMAIAFFLLLAAIVVILVFLKPFDKKEGSDVTTTTAAVNFVKVYFSANGGSELGDIEVAEGTNTALPIPSKDGYLFDGWYLEDDTKVTSDYRFTKETTVYAKWNEITSDIKTMTITFDSKGGTSVNSITLECDNNEATLIGFPVNPVKTNYVFAGWKNANNEIVSVNSKLTCENTTLTANWTEKKESGNGSGNTGTNTTTTTTTTTTTANNRGTVQDNCIDIDGNIKANCMTIDSDTTTTKKTTTKISNPYPSGDAVGCPTGMYLYQNKCVNLNDTNAGTKVCPDVTLDGKSEEGTFRNFGAGFCGYGPILKNIASTQKKCEHFKTQEYGIYHWRAEEYGGSCYKYTSDDYSLTCPSGYIYLQPTEVNQLNGTRSMDKLCYKYQNK